ncbi:hypothetical protein JCM8097_002023 [Rhodosporidiobolus ruineniae]
MSTAFARQQQVSDAFDEVLHELDEAGSDAERILRLDYPSAWPTFLDTFLASAQLSQERCENCLTVLRMLIEEDDDRSSILPLLLAVLRAVEQLRPADDLDLGLLPVAVSTLTAFLDGCSDEAAKTVVETELISLLLAPAAMQALCRVLTLDFVCALDLDEDGTEALAGSVLQAVEAASPAPSATATPAASWRARAGDEVALPLVQLLTSVLIWTPLGWPEADPLALFAHELLGELALDAGTDSSTAILTECCQFYLRIWDPKSYRPIDRALEAHQPLLDVARRVVLTALPRVEELYQGASDCVDGEKVEIESELGTLRQLMLETLTALMSVDQDGLLSFCERAEDDPDFTFYTYGGPLLKSYFISNPSMDQPPPVFFYSRLSQLVRSTLLGSAPPDDPRPFRLLGGQDVLYSRNPVLLQKTVKAAIAVLGTASSYSPETVDAACTAFWHLSQSCGPAMLERFEPSLVDETIFPNVQGITNELSKSTEQLRKFYAALASLARSARTETKRQELLKAATEPLHSSLEALVRVFLTERTHPPPHDMSNARPSLPQVLSVMSSVALSLRSGYVEAFRPVFAWLIVVHGGSLIRVSEAKRMHGLEAALKLGEVQSCRHIFRNLHCVVEGFTRDSPTFGSGAILELPSSRSPSPVSADMRSRLETFIEQIVTPWLETVMPVFAASPVALVDEKMLEFLQTVLNCFGHTLDPSYRLKLLSPVLLFMQKAVQLDLSGSPGGFKDCPQLQKPAYWIFSSAAAYRWLASESHPEAVQDELMHLVVSGMESHDRSVAKSACIAGQHFLAASNPDRVASMSYGEADSNFSFFRQHALTLAGHAWERLSDSSYENAFEHYAILVLSLLNIAKSYPHQRLFDPDDYFDESETNEELVKRWLGQRLLSSFPLLRSKPALHLAVVEDLWDPPFVTPNADEACVELLRDHLLDLRHFRGVSRTTM